MGQNGVTNHPFSTIRRLLMQTRVQLLHSWTHHLQILPPHVRRPRVRVLALCSLALCWTELTVLVRLAAALPLPANDLSTERAGAGWPVLGASSRSSGPRCCAPSSPVTTARSSCSSSVPPTRPMGDRGGARAGHPQTRDPAGLAGAGRLSGTVVANVARFAGDPARIASPLRRERPAGCKCRTAGTSLARRSRLPSSWTTSAFPAPFRRLDLAMVRVCNAMALAPKLAGQLVAAQLSRSLPRVHGADGRGRSRRNGSGLVTCPMAAAMVAQLTRATQQGDKAAHQRGRQLPQTGGCDPAGGAGPGRTA